MWKKRYCAYTKKNVWCSKKATFHFQRTLHELTRTFPFWFERNEIGYDYINYKQQSFVYSKVFQRQKSKHFAKNKRLLRTESLLMHTIFTEYRQQEKFAYASCEPHYAVAERHLIVLHIWWLVLQNNRWFCAKIFQLIIQRFKLLNACIAISASCCGYQAEDDLYCDCKRIVTF